MPKNKKTTPNIVSQLFQNIKLLFAMSPQQRLQLLILGLLFIKTVESTEVKSRPPTEKMQFGIDNGPSEPWDKSHLMHDQIMLSMLENTYAALQGKQVNIAAYYLNEAKKILTLQKEYVTESTQYELIILEAKMAVTRNDFPTALAILSQSASNSPNNPRILSVLYNTVLQMKPQAELEKCGRIVTFSKLYGKDITASSSKQDNSEQMATYHATGLVAVANGFIDGIDGDVSEIERGIGLLNQAATLGSKLAQQNQNSFEITRTMAEDIKIALKSSQELRQRALVMASINTHKKLQAVQASIEQAHEELHKKKFAAAQKLISSAMLQSASPGTEALELQILVTKIALLNNNYPDALSKATKTAADYPNEGRAISILFNVILQSSASDIEKCQAIVEHAKRYGKSISADNKFKLAASHHFAGVLLIANGIVNDDEELVGNGFHELRNAAAAHLEATQLDHNMPETLNAMAIDIKTAFDYCLGIRQRATAINMSNDGKNYKILLKKSEIKKTSLTRANFDSETIKRTLIGNFFLAMHSEAKFSPRGIEITANELESSDIPPHATNKHWVLANNSNKISLYLGYRNNSALYFQEVPTGASQLKHVYQGVSYILSPKGVIYTTEESLKKAFPLINAKSLTSQMRSLLNSFAETPLWLQTVAFLVLTSIMSYLIKACFAMMKKDYGLRALNILTKGVYDKTWQKNGQGFSLDLSSINTNHKQKKKPILDFLKNELTAIGHVEIDSHILSINFNPDLDLETIKKLQTRLQELINRKPGVKEKKSPPAPDQFVAPNSSTVLKPHQQLSPITARDEKTILLEGIQTKIRELQRKIAENEDYFDAKKDDKTLTNAKKHYFSTEAKFFISISHKLEKLLKDSNETISTLPPQNQLKSYTIEDLTKTDEKLSSLIEEFNSTNKTEFKDARLACEEFLKKAHLQTPEKTKSAAYFAAPKPETQNPPLSHAEIVDDLREGLQHIRAIENRYEAISRQRAKREWLTAENSEKSKKKQAKQEKIIQDNPVLNDVAIVSDQLSRILSLSSSPLFAKLFDSYPDFLPSILNVLMTRLAQNFLASKHFTLFYSTNKNELFTIEKSSLRNAFAHHPLAYKKFSNEVITGAKEFFIGADIIITHVKRYGYKDIPVIEAKSAIFDPILTEKNLASIDSPQEILKQIKNSFARITALSQVQAETPEIATTQQWMILTQIVAIGEAFSNLYKQASNPDNKQRTMYLRLYELINPEIKKHGLCGEFINSSTQQPYFANVYQGNRNGFYHTLFTVEMHEEFIPFSLPSAETIGAIAVASAEIFNNKKLWAYCTQELKTSPPTDFFSQKNASISNIKHPEEINPIPDGDLCNTRP